jgi:hypothetical protein
MKQRIPHIWTSARRAGGRPRVLIEDDHPAVAISDFAMFKDAGFDVAYCSGPDHVLGECPLLRGERCALLAGADAVLHRLDPRLGIAPAIQEHQSHTAVVVEQPPDTGRGPHPPAAGYEPVVYGCSVKGQIRALRQALRSREVADRETPHRPASSAGRAAG